MNRDREERGMDGWRNKDKELDSSSVESLTGKRKKEKKLHRGK